MEASLTLTFVSCTLWSQNFRATWVKYRKYFSLFVYQGPRWVEIMQKWGSKISWMTHYSLKVGPYQWKKIRSAALYLTKKTSRKLTCIQPGSGTPAHRWAVSYPFLLQKQEWLFSPGQPRAKKQELKQEILLAFFLVLILVLGRDSNSEPQLTTVSYISIKQKSIKSHFEIFNYGTVLKIAVFWRSQLAQIPTLAAGEPSLDGGSGMIYSDSDPTTLAMYCTMRMAAGRSLPWPLAYVVRMEAAGLSLPSALAYAVRMAAAGRCTRTPAPAGLASCSPPPTPGSRSADSGPALWCRASMFHPN